jgi:thiamine pyrophosphokinase
MSNPVERAWLFTSTAPEVIFSGYDSIDPERDLVVAVDNGLDRVRQLGLAPDVVIGDMDSVTPGLLEQYPATPVIRHPGEKNETDTELAALWALEQGVGHIIICNNLEGRFDHALALIQNMDLVTSKGVDCKIESATQQVFFLEKETILRGLKGAWLSLLAWGGVSHLADSQGLQYPLHRLELRTELSRGISNRIVEDEARIGLASGRILAIITR